MPDFKYDQVEEVKRNYSENTWYYFGKNINGIPTSECVTIRLTPKGEFSFFNSFLNSNYLFPISISCD